MEKEQKLRILAKEPGKTPVMTWIPKNPDAYEEAVGGHVQVLRIGDLACICWEEAKYWGEPKNCKFGNLTLCGTVFFCSIINGKIASLNVSEEEMKKKMPYLWGE